MRRRRGTLEHPCNDQLAPHGGRQVGQLRPDGRCAQSCPVAQRSGQALGRHGWMSEGGSAPTASTGGNDSLPDQLAAPTPRWVVSKLRASPPNTRNLNNPVHEVRIDFPRMWERDFLNRQEFPLPRNACAIVERARTLAGRRCGVWRPHPRPPPSRWSSISFLGTAVARKRRAAPRRRRWKAAADDARPENTTARTTSAPASASLKWFIT